MLKMSSRTDCSVREAVMIRTSAIILALVSVAFFISIIGHNPFSVYLSMAEGAFGSTYRITETIRKAIPLIIVSLGISLAFRLRFWNIGAEGQVMMGAFGATFCALNFQNLPSYILLPLMACASILCGGHMGCNSRIFPRDIQDKRNHFHSYDELYSPENYHLSPVWPVERSRRTGLPENSGFYRKCDSPLFFRTPYRMDYCAIPDYFHAYICKTILKEAMKSMLSVKARIQGVMPELMSDSLSSIQFLSAAGCAVSPA